MDLKSDFLQKRDNKVVYVKDGKCYKVFNKECNQANILNEACNQARVQETGLNIPKLLEVTMLDGHFTIVMESIEGETLEDKLLKNPEKHTEILNRFVDLQIETHSKRCPLLTKHHDKMNRKVSETDLSATLRYDLHNRIEAMPNYNCLCHGDYELSNVIIDKDDKAYIIDWSHATQGNPEADAARTFLMFLVENRNALAKEYLDIFCKKSCCNYKEIISWLPILAASQSVKNKIDEANFLKSIIYMDDKQLENLYEQI